jgi:acyl carrier protein phosphodiesterase
MTENSPEPGVRRFADLDALRQQLEEMASRRNRSEKAAEDRWATVQEPTLVIRGK